MVQPTKNIIGEKKKVVTKKTSSKAMDKRLPPSPKKSKTPRKHKEYGTSKLERDFARDFLDKLGIKYIYQFKAESIGRYFDFYCMEANAIIEVDGDYW